MNISKSDHKNIAIIFAGGTGVRMGYKRGPKQFMEANGKPILIYTLERFQTHKSIDAIYIATVDTYIKYTEKLVAKHEISKVKKIVSGGRTAHHSIINALNSAHEDVYSDKTIALIHDGVRPIISASLIQSNIQDTLATSTSITSIPAFETISKSRDGVQVEKVLNRESMYILQAPQAFYLNTIVKTNQRAIDDNTAGRYIDQAQMASHYGLPLTLTQGMRANIKITTPHDFDYFNYLVNSGHYKELTDS